LFSTLPSGTCSVCPPSCARREVDEDLAIDLTRLRRCDSVDLALLEKRILKDLIREDTHAPEYAI